MKLQNRIEILSRLGNYLSEAPSSWKEAAEKAQRMNGWFTQEFIELATNNIVSRFLEKGKLEQWTAHYHLDDNITPKNVGVVMAGNIPLVGFHDFLSVFISGHHQIIKLSSKDDVLLKHLVEKLIEWEPSIGSKVVFADMLKGADAYIATGSNNSARYFEQYFSKYPHIIRRNRTSVAILNGDETLEELSLLSNDVHQFFGLGCRNVTKIFVPEGYDFVPLLRAFDGYNYFRDHNKFRNNYDYQLSLALMNKVYYMCNECTLLLESDAVFSPISQLHYSFYKNGKEEVEASLKNQEEIQAIVGKGNIPFGQAQQPGLFDYADGVDTMEFFANFVDDVRSPS